MAAPTAPPAPPAPPSYEQAVSPYTPCKLINEIILMQLF